MDIVKNSNDSFNVNNSLLERAYNTKESKDIDNSSLLQKIYHSQLEKMGRVSPMGLSFGPTPNFAVKDKTMSYIKDSKASLNNTKSRIFESNINLSCLL